MWPQVHLALASGEMPAIIYQRQRCSRDEKFLVDTIIRLSLQRKNCASVRAEVREKAHESLEKQAKCAGQLASQHVPMRVEWGKLATSNGTDLHCAGQRGSFENDTGTVDMTVGWFEWWSSFPLLYRATSTCKCVPGRWSGQS